MAYTKEEHAAYQREWRRKNPEKVAAIRRKHRLKDDTKEKTAAYAKEYKRKNREKLNAKRREWRRKDREKWNAKTREWHLKNPEKKAALDRKHYGKRLDRYRQKKTGWTPEQYKEKLAEQGGCCAICGVGACTSGKALAADHCHKTGKTRGLLCAKCNLSIGMLGDSLEGIMRAAHYLARYETETSYEPTTHVPPRSSLGPERIDTGRPACEPWQG